MLRIIRFFILLKSLQRNRRNFTARFPIGVAAYNAAIEHKIGRKLIITKSNQQNYQSKYVFNGAPQCMGIPIDI